MSGKRIQAFRRKTGMTQAQMAELVGVSANTIARWERNEVRITPPMELLLKRIMAEHAQPPRSK